MCPVQHQITQCASQGWEQDVGCLSMCMVMGADEFAQVFVKEVFRLHRIPSPWSDTNSSVTHKFLAKVYELLIN